MGFVARDGEHGVSNSHWLGIGSVARIGTVGVEVKDDGVQQFIFGRMLWINESDWNTGFTRIGQRLVPALPVGVGNVDAADNHDFDRASYEIGNTLLCGDRILVDASMSIHTIGTVFAGSAGVRRFGFTGYTISCVCRACGCFERGIVDIEFVIRQRIDDELVCGGVSRPHKADCDIRGMCGIVGDFRHAVLGIADRPTGRRAGS